MNTIRQILKPAIVLFISAFIGISALPAEANVVVEIPYVQLHAQTLTVPTDIAIPAVSRDGYTVSTYAIWPTNGHEITDCFGCRGGSHRGLDISYLGINGTPVYAVASGCIDIAGWDGDYGNQVLMSNPHFGVQTRYAHMIDGSLQVSPGQCIEAGQVLGLVGSTGNSTGPHLHFEVMVGGVVIDPLSWLQANAL